MRKNGDHFDDIFAEAFACFEQGLSYDEVDDKTAATAFYERGLNLVCEINKDKRAKRSKLYKNMMDSCKRTEERLKVLKSSECGQSVGNGTEDRIENENQVKLELRKEIEAASTGEAELIFFIPDGVQLFMIEGDKASSPTIPAPLEIFRFSGAQQKDDYMHVDAFMKVGLWIYPLISNRTPVLKNEYGAYIVSNPVEGKPDLSVGILLPSDLDEQCEQDFCNTLKLYSELQFREVSPSLSEEENTRLSRKIAMWLIKGSERIASGINFAAEKTNQVVSSNSSKLQEYVKPINEPTTINPALRTSVHYVHRGSKVIAKCTRYLLDKVGEIGMGVGRRLASTADQHLGDGKGGGIVGDTIDVLSGGITGASMVWITLENASKTMCRNIADETVNVVQIKYGDDASSTAHKALYATGHSTLAAFQIWDLGPRSIAGRAVRKAGVQFVNELSTNKSGVPSANSKSEAKKFTSD